MLTQYRVISICEILRIESLFFFFIFDCTLQHGGPYFPDQGLNPHPPVLEGSVLTPGLPGKSQH